MPATQTYKDKAYINGKWVAAKSGQTFAVTSESSDDAEPEGYLDRIALRVVERTELEERKGIENGSGDQGDRSKGSR